ncbi:hypothetical protein GCM10009680_78540 [Streptomyces yatensis]|uniref:Uncharacterized protein n=1 Tax=Streptomyces yatensis TaxID=155177 RepID=A0ABP4VFU8_9ACTN
MAKYFDVHPENPQQRTISKVADMIRSGALIGLPDGLLLRTGMPTGQ